MKFILVISFVFSLLLSNETRLIIGCFKEPKNAENAKIKIDEFVQNNTEFKNFLERNSVTTKNTLIGNWNVISFEPFNDSTNLFITYFKIKDMYPNAYKVDINAQDEEQILASNYKEELPSSQDDMKNSSTSQNEKIMTFQDEMKQTSSAQNEVTQPVQSEQAQKQDAVEVTKDTQASTKSNEQKSGVPYLYPLLIAVLILVAVIIYFTQRKPKKTLHTLKEDFEEDLS